MIAFLSAIMRKTALPTDTHRRHAYVRALQESTTVPLPRADATWPTCLIIAPKTVVGNWARELEVWGWFEVGVLGGGAAVGARAKEERERVLTDFKMGRLDIGM